MFDGESSGICLERTIWNAIPLILIGSNRFDPYQIFKILRNQFRALKRRWVAWHWLRLSFKTSRDLKFGSNHFGSAPPMAAIFSVMVFLVRPTTLMSWIQFDNKKGSQDVPIPNALKMKVEGIRCEFLKHAFLFIAMNFKMNLKHSKTDNFLHRNADPNLLSYGVMKPRNFKVTRSVSGDCCVVNLVSSNWVTCCLICMSMVELPPPACPTFRLLNENARL